MKIYYFIILLLITCYNLQGQQLPLYSQYKLNNYVVNPAVAGSSGRNNFNLLVRNMWVGYKEAPRTYILSGEYRLLKRSLQVGNSFLGKRLYKRSKGNNGIGGFLYQDNNANINRFGLGLGYSYHIKFHYSQLSFGLSSHIYQYNIRKDKLKPIHYEPLLEKEDHSSLCTDASFGAYFSSRSVFYIGLSGNELLQSVDFKSTIVENYSILRHYFFMTGYRFGISREIVFEPSTLIKFNEQKLVQTDFNLKLSYLDEYWGGIAFRNNYDLIFMFGVRFSSMYLAYSFDYGFGRIYNYNVGSHEINLGICFGTENNKERWMDRF